MQVTNTALQKCVAGYLLLYLLSVANLSLADTLPVKIFVSVLPQKYLVEQIGKQHVEVSTMVAAGQNPSTYAPKPKQMTELASCDIYLTIGVPFEKLWIKKIRQYNEGLKIINMQPANDALHHEVSHDHNHELGPHIWTSPRQLRIMAQHIAKILSDINPESRDLYYGNLRRLEEELVSLDSKIRRMLNESQTRHFMVFHPAWDYFADEYQLKQIAIERQGKEPGARMITELIQSAREHNIKKVFTQRQFNSSSAKTIAKAIGGEVVETDPLAENVIDNLLAFTRLLTTAD